MLFKIKKIINIILVLVLGLLLLSGLSVADKEGLVSLKSGEFLGDLDSLSSESLVGQKSGDSWSLVVLLTLDFLGDSLNDSLLDVDVGDLDCGLVLGTDVVGVLWQAEELSDLVGSLWAESVVLLDVSESGDFLLSSGKEDEV